MPFTNEQKARILYFLNYPEWQSLSNGIQLGIPAGTHALFLVMQSFDRLGEGGVNNALQVLDELEAIECQITDARRRLRARRIGNVETNDAELPALKIELEEWRQRLSNVMGAPINPYTLQNPSTGGMFARRIG